MLTLRTQLLTKLPTKLLTALLVSCALLMPAHGADRPATSAELQDFAGQYTLADGRTLSIVLRRHQLVAQLDGQAPSVLVATGPARFAGRDKRLAVAFDQRPNGNVAAVTLSLPPTMVRQ